MLFSSGCGTCDQFRHEGLMQQTIVQYGEIYVYEEFDKYLTMHNEVIKQVIEKYATIQYTDEVIKPVIFDVYWGREYIERTNLVQFDKDFIKLIQEDYRKLKEAFMKFGVDAKLDILGDEDDSLVDKLIYRAPTDKLDLLPAKYIRGECYPLRVDGWSRAYRISEK